MPFDVDYQQLNPLPIPIEIKASLHIHTYMHTTHTHKAHIQHTHKAHIQHTHTKLTHNTHTKLTYNTHTQEDRCTLPTAPHNGMLVSCSDEYRATCTIRCQQGYSASGGRNASVGSGVNVIGSAGHVVLRCDESSKSWEGTPPLCNECADSYYMQGGTCLACTTSECPRGMYRAGCSASADAPCVPCTTSLPAQGYYATGGSPYYQDNCLVACAAGFVLSSDGTACVPAVTAAPSITVGSPDTLQLSETYKQAKVLTFPLSLTVAPTSTVVVKVSVSRQLTLTDSSGARPKVPLLSKSVTFTTANYALVQNVSIDAWDDVVYEGEHGGLVYFSVESTDPAYTKLQVDSLFFIQLRAMRSCM
jgi:hypothetical protein